jgi:hypothetical protein
MSFKVDFCDFKAAEFACKHWHYSKTMPSGKLIKMGIWEDDRFIGVVLFGRGANNNIGKPYGLQQTQVCELVRIALTNHKTEVTKIVKIALLLLKKVSPKLVLVISYADPEQNHHGGVYQGGNWIYEGTSQAQAEVIYKGKVMHKRTANSLFGTIKGMEKSKVFFKHKYIMPISEEMKIKAEKLRKPYPKRVKEQAVGFPSTLGGATPTHTLQM